MTVTNLFDTTSLGDPTINLALKGLQEREGRRSPSRRLGGSSLGQECVRSSWLGFRWVSPVIVDATGLLAINDGHRSEIVMADLLKGAGGGIELWTEDPNKPGKQISFELIDGHFVAKCDGVILGILQAPKTPHIWEAKACNEKKFKALKGAIDKHGEKNALREWNNVYFIQAQMEMHGVELDRHYLTVSTPGVREIISVRTEYQHDVALRAIETGKRIVYDTRAPARISADPSFFGCKFCDHIGVCHGNELPQVNCRTCAYSSAVEGGKWTCGKWQVGIDYDTQRNGCFAHRFNPETVHGKAIDVKENGDVHYTMANGSLYVDADKPDRPATINIGA